MGTTAMPFATAVAEHWIDGESGAGRLRGPLAITEFQEAKTVVHSIPPASDNNRGH